MSSPGESGADIKIGDEQPASHPLAHLFATVERSVNEFRSGEISSWDVRQQARARGVGQDQAWIRIRNGRSRRPRGAR